MKTRVDSFVTIKEKLFAILCQFHVVIKQTLYVGGVTCAAHVGAPVCVVVL